MMREYWESVPPRVQSVMKRMARIAAIAIAGELMYDIMGPSHGPRPYWQEKVGHDKARHPGRGL